MSGNVHLLEKRAEARRKLKLAPQAEACATADTVQRSIDMSAAPFVKAGSF